MTYTFDPLRILWWTIIFTIASQGKLSWYVVLVLGLLEIKCSITFNKK